MRTFHSTALLALALLAGFVNQACSTTLPEHAFIQEEEVVADVPPLFVVESPREGATYTDADDVDPAPGLQLPLIVRVHDRENGVAVHEIAVRVGAAHYERVAVDDGAFGRTARAHITVAEPGVAMTVTVRVEAKGDDLPPLMTETHVSVRAGEPQPCASTLTLAGDLVVSSPADLEGLLGESCVVISGDLVVEESALDELSGLEPIVHVTGSVRIARNHALERIDALASLRFIGGDLVVRENPALPAADIEALVEAIGEEAVMGEIVVESAS